MKAKTRRALLYIFMSLFILTMFTASLTLGRYSAELESDGDYQGDYEYILTDTLVVNSVDEFFDAIENGYSNIQIGDDVDNPLIIAGDINDVRTDLTIDLNGHEIQRNNRDPLLNVDDGITLTIIDSKGGGSLYNPVGSVLRVGDEGTITVAAGIFESGPRSSNARNGENAYNEYYSSTDNSTGAGARIDSNNTLSVQYYGRTDNEQDGYSYQLTDENGTATLPIIIPNVKSTPTETEWCHTVNGNMFFSSAIGGYNSSIMQDDTYLYFTVEGDSVQNTAIAASNTSANYYYQYYVQLNNENSSNAGYTYAGAPVYNNDGNITNRPTGEDIYLATVYVYNKVKGTVAADNPYAAIEATGGNIYVRGGTYYSYFGKENTYCINANSGYMSVDSSNAISFYAYGNGVCVQCNYSTDNLQTRAGDVDLRITNGNFYSELGDTISVTNGVMEIGTATFTKDASATGNNVSEGDNNSVIDISSGTLTISNSAQLNILGSGVTGISARSGAEIETNNTTIEFNNNQQNGYTYNFGISSNGGNISCRGTTKLYITGSNSTGILSSRGTITGGTITGGTINIEGEFNCNVKMLSDSGVGSSELSSTVIYTNGGTVNLNTTTDNGVNTDGSVDYGTEIESDGFGFVVYSGDLNIMGTGTTHIETTRGTAVYLNGGTLKVDSNSTLDVVSEIDGSCTWAMDSTSTQNLNRYNGVYIRGGSLDSQGTLNVTHTGVANDISGLDDTTAYYYHQIKSYAVRVEGTEGTTEDTKVTIKGGEISNSVGGGLFVSNGEVNLSNATVQARGVGSHDKYTFNYNWTYYASEYGGHAVEVENGILNIDSGQYSSAQGNGILVRNGTVTILDGIFKGNDVSSSAGASASYAFKMYGGTVTITNGTFGNSTELGNSTAGGAFVMGVSSTATAYIDGGDFVVNGSTGFSVWTNSNVRFGGEFGATVPNVSGVSTGLAIEDSGGNPSTITINNGEFKSTETNTGDRNKHGIAYLDSSAVLSIANGQFTSQVGSGLYFAVAPGTTNNVNNVQLSGGTYVGVKNSTSLGNSWGLTTLNNATTNNAISAAATIQYSSILGGSRRAHGYVEIADNCPGYVENEDYYLTGNINSLAEGALKYDYRYLGMDMTAEANGVYSRIVIESNS